MDKFEQHKLQKNVQDSCEELRTTLADIYKWEKDIKEQEVRIKDDNSESLPVRSQMSGQTKTQKENRSNVLSAGRHRADDSESRDSAVKMKDKGNYHVKLGEYKEAIECYTEAISQFDKDTTFYTNRALCYLKLEEFDNCIEDCNKAIKLNPKTVKAFYRLMQAYESLGEHHRALKNCEMVLEIDSNNQEAKRSLERIKKRLDQNSEKTILPTTHGTLQPAFTSVGPNLIEIQPANKPPHKQSKVCLKKISVEECCEKSRNIKEDKDIRNTSIIGKNSMNDNNADENETVEQQTEIIDSKQYANIEKTGKKPKKVLLSPPESPAQFYTTWKDLSSSEKYEYLKNIDSGNINKILGACLDADTLSEILCILNEYFIKNQTNFLNLLSKISEHNEINILSFFLSSNDREVLKKLCGYLQDTGSDLVEIDKIKSRFGI